MTAAMPSSEVGTEALLGALHEALEQEHAALRHGDGEAVIGAARTKHQLTERLATVLPQDAALPAALGELARRCHELNRRNGEILRLQQSTLARAMRVLSGNDATPCLYGAHGQTHSTGAGRHITSA